MLQSFYEVARPQVHGYDINCISCLRKPDDGGDRLPFRILSGADEKVMRLFEAPYSFVKTFNGLSAPVASGDLPPIKFVKDMTND